MATTDDHREAASGMAFWLKWSKDETVAKLRIHTKDGQQKCNVAMTVADLDELRRFLNDRIEP